MTSGGAAPVGRLRAAGKLLALLGLGGILATSWITATGVSARHDSGHAGALQGLAGPLTADGFRTALLVLGLCYLVVLACGIAGTLPRRPALVTVIVAQLLFALMAIAPGQDLYTYLGFARLESIHGINPYEHGLIAARDDPLFELAAFRRTTTPYGPLFTLITIAVTPLPVAVAAWTLKAILVSAMLGCLGIVWAIARELRQDATLAVAFVGLNPAILVYAVGKGHNDGLMMLPLLVAALLIVRGRDLAAGASAVLAVGVKVIAVIMLPLLLIASRKRRAIAVGGAAAGFVAIAISFAVFGVEPVHVLQNARRDQGLINRDTSLIGLFGRALGLPLRDVARDWGSVIFVAAYALVLVAAWRTPAEWIRWSSWAMVALLATSAAFFPWYLLWVLPLAAVSGSRLLQGAAIGLTATSIGVFTFS